MARTALEEELSEITREFVVRIVTAIRGASFADVASFSGSASPANARAKKAPSPPAHDERPSRSRQTAEKRKELSARLLQVLAKSGEPMGVRALSGELKVAPDRLLLPLKDLRNAGKVTKHGDKRNTRYAVA
jgi:hypothetical protein